MKHHTVHPLKAITLMMGTVAVLTACGGGGDSAAPASTTTLGTETQVWKFGALETITVAAQGT